MLRKPWNPAWSALLLLAGILLAFWLPSAWSRGAWVACAGLAALLVWRRPLRPLLWLPLGFAQAQWATWQVVPVPAGSERLLVEARIDSVPGLGAGGWQFDARVRFPRHAQWPAPRVRLALPAAARAPQPGERWQYVVQFGAAPDAAGRRAQLRDHLGGRARVLDSRLNRRMAAGGGGIDALRARLAERIDARVADPSAAALLAALAVGVTGDVSDRQWRTFNATGITHLVAISGMHVTFFAMLSMKLARLLWRRLAWAGAPRRESFAAVVGVTLALIYALLSGFSVPAQRTVAMLAAFLALRQCGRCAPPEWSVAMALVAVLLWDPMAALSAGFWLSFGAVAAIVLLAGARVLPAAPLAGAAQLQWLVTVALLPFTLAIFGSFSAVGLLANVFAIPVFTLLLVPPVLLATLALMLPGGVAAWCANGLLDLAAAAAQSVWPALAWCASLPGALWHADVPLSWYLLSPALVLLVLLPLRVAPRALAALALLSVFVLRAPRPAAGELWVDVRDVGAATALVLRTRGHLLLWGSAETFGSGGQRFTRHVLPALRSAGYPALDLWLPGSPGRDVQAALLAAREVHPQRVVVPGDARGVPPEMAACADRNWTWDGLRFALGSDAQGRCTLAVAAGSRQLLLGYTRAPADAGVQAAWLLPRAAGAVRMLSFQPGQVVLASVSRGEWESPAWRRERARLREQGALALATAADGTLHLGMDARGLRRRGLHQQGKLPFGRGLFSYDARPCGNSC